MEVVHAKKCKQLQRCVCVCVNMGVGAGGCVLEYAPECVCVRAHMPGCQIVFESLNYAREKLS